MFPFMRETLPRSGFGAGWIEVVVGSMFSGKTEELIRRIRRAQMARQKIQVFKPHIDVRYSQSEVASHNQNRQESIPVQKASDILASVNDTTRVVAIDEAQFFDAGLVDVVERLANRGLRVILAGLDMDWQGRPFGPMPQLMAVAEEVTKLHAICVCCGGVASRTQRLTAGQGQILVGSEESYEARCRACFDPHAAIMEEKNARETSSEALESLPVI